MWIPPPVSFPLSADKQKASRWYIFEIVTENVLLLLLYLFVCLLLLEGRSEEQSFQGDEAPGAGVAV